LFCPSRPRPIFGLRTGLDSCRKTDGLRPHYCQIQHDNTREEGRVLWVNHTIAYCKNASRSLSAIAEFLVEQWAA